MTVGPKLHFWRKKTFWTFHYVQFPVNLLVKTVWQNSFAKLVKNAFKVAQFHWFMLQSCTENWLFHKLCSLFHLENWSQDWTAGKRPGLAQLLITTKFSNEKEIASKSVEKRLKSPLAHSHPLKQSSTYSSPGNFQLQLFHFGGFLFGTSQLVAVCFVRESFPILQSNPHLRNTFDLPLVAYKRPRNLLDLLTSRPRADPNGPSKDRPNGTFPCEVARCKTCEVVRNIETFRYKTNNTHLVQEHFTCASTSVVYLISCGHPKSNAV